MEKQATTVAQHMGVRAAALTLGVRRRLNRRSSLRAMVPAMPFLGRLFRREARRRDRKLEPSCRP